MHQSRSGTGSRPTVPYWAAASFIAAASAITWWLSGINASHGLGHMIGPYQVPLVIEYIVGGTAVALGLMALRTSAKSTQFRGAVTRSTSAVLVLTAITATGLWRVMTVGGDGANIGGGVAALAGPFLLAALLFLALCVERFNAGMDTRAFAGLSVLTLGTGPILAAALWFGLAPN